MVQYSKYNRCLLAGRISELKMVNFFKKTEKPNTKFWLQNSFHSVYYLLLNRLVFSRGFSVVTPLIEALHDVTKNDRQAER